VANQSLAPLSLRKFGLVFLLAPVIVVPLFRRLRSSPIVGYLVAGIVIGPHALGLIVESELTSLLAELGVAFLLFAIGLGRVKTRDRRGWDLGRRGDRAESDPLYRIRRIWRRKASSAIMVGSGVA
jgi:hypothetical protein